MPFTHRVLAIALAGLTVGLVLGWACAPRVFG